jgi:hypothetical protein
MRCLSVRNEAWGHEAIYTLAVGTLPLRVCCQTRWGAGRSELGALRGVALDRTGRWGVSCVAVTRE